MVSFIKGSLRFNGQWKNVAPENESEENHNGIFFRARTFGADGGSGGDLLLARQPGDGHRDNNDAQSFGDNLDENIPPPGIPCRLVEQGTA